MKKICSFLIIEDHPLISNSYLDALQSVQSDDENVNFEKIGIAKNCDEAIASIKAARKSKGIDIIFLDIQIPSSSDGKILSGEDLGVIIRETLPKSKIIISTMYNDNYRIYNIMNTVNPVGFLVKNDLNPTILVEAIKNVMRSHPYYSPTVLLSIRRQFPNRELLDDVDRRMLFELSRGVKMKDLPSIIPMSLAGLEKRKRRLKEVFNVDQMEDRYLILAAKEKGFI
jgi:DNA-binding NarL/FixJ family response regulator